jgi:hypothetical protein
MWRGSVNQAFHELSREHLVITPVVRRAKYSSLQNDF